MKRRSPRRSRHTTSRGLRFESLETRRLLAADCLHNLPYPEDVNGDTHASPLDALAVINHLISPGEALGEGESAAGLYLDVNNDLNVTAADALNVVNHLNAPSASSHSSSDSDDNDDSGDDSGDESEDDEQQDVELKAHLTGVGSEHGEAEYEIEDEHGAVKQEFEVEVEDAEPGTTHDVLVDGVVVGQLTIDSEGHGKLKLSSDPEDDELPLPDDFPPVTNGTPVDVGDIVRGSFGNAQPASHDSSSDSDDNDDSEDDEQEDVELKAYLTGAGSEHGEAEYEIEDEHGAVKQEFEVEVEDAEPGTTHDVLVDGVVVGRLTIDSEGHGKLKLSSDPEDDELPLPDGFPPVGENSSIVIGDILEGILRR